MLVEEGKEPMLSYTKGCKTTQLFQRKGLFLSGIDDSDNIFLK